MNAGARIWKRVGPAVDHALHEVLEPPREKPFRLGILFVHGMGEQERGDTITQMGDALTEWLRRYLGNDRFRILDASLRGRDSAVTGTASPSVSGRAHSTVILSQHDRSEGGDAWLLAESWWADAFRPATFGELVAWAIAVGPWLIASQAAGLSQRFRAVKAHESDEAGEATAPDQRSFLRRSLDYLVGWVLLAMAAIAAAVITPLAIVLLVLSLIPIPFVSDLFRGLARNLAGSFGDLLVLVRSPMRFAAMAERVRDDIDSLGRDCDRVMVVAHSQGSAVAWHAIRRTAQRPPDQRANVQMFFTFGQAFRKLKSLHRLRTRVSRRTQLWFAVLTAGSTLLLLSAVWLGFVVAGTLIANRGDLGATWDDATIPILLLTACAVLVGLVQARLAHLARYNDIEAQRLIVSDIRDVRSALPAFRWVDVWASADPAPNGPLFTRPVDHVASYRIRNLASTALDHSVYWSNVTEFVSAVAFHASALTPSAPLGVEPIPSALRKAATVRESRVSTLALARLAIIAGSVAALWGLRHDLPDIGSGILGYISSLPLVPDWFSGWPPRAQGVIGALAIVAVAMAVWWILTWLWAALIHADEDAFFAKSDQPAWHAWSTAWFGAAVAVPTIAIGALAVVSGEFGALVLYGVGGLLGLGIVTLLRGREATFANPPEAFAPSADEPVPDLADHAASVGGARSDRADVSERHDDLLPDAYDG